MVGVRRGHLRSPEMDRQDSLFDLPPRAVAPAPPRAEIESLAAELPDGIRFGTMSWSYPGWAGIVYGAELPARELAAHGLTAYAKHPLLRVVEIDRSYYEPLAVDVLRGFAAQTPEDFRFVVKAHEDCVVHRFPGHARYGKKRGERNARYLDAAYAGEAVIAPLVAGLGEKAGALLFQFPPQDVGEPPGAFADRLHDFLRGLPKGTTYAVELRNADLFTPSYVAALADAGAIHCHTVWPGMPPLLFQAKHVPPIARRPLLLRWLMRAGDEYQRAAARSAPFDRIAFEDTTNRAAIARLAAMAERHGVPVSILVDNKAEGCAPESIVRLARAVADARGAAVTA